MLGRRGACLWLGCAYTIQNEEHNATLVLTKCAKVVGTELM